MKEIHDAIIRTESRLDQAVENNLEFYADILRVHLGNLLKAVSIELEREAKELCGIEVSYRLQPELVEKLKTLDEWADTQSQLPQDNAEAFAAAVDYADGWIDWGGQNTRGPVTTGRLEVKFRNGTTSLFDARYVKWGHEFPGRGPSPHDVVAWRPA